MPAPQTPIVVTDQTATSAIWTIIRYILTGIGGWLTSKGFATEDTVQTVIGAVIAVGPTIWGAILSIHNKRKLITAAEAAPNSVAKVVS